MKRFISAFTIWGVALPLVATAFTPAILAQESLPVESLPVLEMPTATSASALQGFDNRQVQTDYDFMFLPAGTGGEQSTDSWDYSLAPLNQVEDNVTGPYRTIPSYAVVEPNRSIETQTDPERLTIQVPTERGS